MASHLDKGNGETAQHVTGQAKEGAALRHQRQSSHWPGRAWRHRALLLPNRCALMWTCCCTACMLALTADIVVLPSSVLHACRCKHASACIVCANFESYPPLCVFLLACAPASNISTAAELYDDIWVLPVYRHMFSDKRKSMAHPGSASFDQRLEMCK
jgi:hypothetical protein